MSRGATSVNEGLTAVTTTAAPSGVPSGATSPPTKKAKTKYPKIFQCSGYGDCRMTFTRSEHLARHIRKHTGERPFRCHCNRYFSRLDNLRQHIQTVHANEHHILHATPPSPLPHSNKVPGQHNGVRHSLSAGTLGMSTKPLSSDYGYGYQQQHQHHQQPLPLLQGHSQPPPPPPDYAKHHNIIIEHQGNPQQLPPPSPSSLNFQPTSFRPRHRPHPITLKLEHDGSPPESPMNSATTPRMDHSPSSPRFSSPGFQHRPSQESLTHMQSAHNPHGFMPGMHNAPPPDYPAPFASQAYPPLPALPTTPVAPSNGYGDLPMPQHTPVQRLYTSPSLDTLSNDRSLTNSVASSRHVSSALTTPLSTGTTNSWLSSVLCDAPPSTEERPHTWGPTGSVPNGLGHNRFSATDETTSQGDRSSLPTLVRISEDTDMTDMSSPEYNDKLPSVSHLLSRDDPPALLNGGGYANGRPPQMGPTSNNRAHLKNLILPPPESYPSVGVGYALPVADTRPPAVPPAGGAGVVPAPSSRSRRSNLSKPLPPLPGEKELDVKEPAGNGMDVLLAAAGV